MKNAAAARTVVDKDNVVIPSLSKDRKVRMADIEFSQLSPSRVSVIAISPLTSFGRNDMH